MSELIEKARQARAFMQLAGKYVPDETAITMPSFFDPWKIKDYSEGEKVRYGDQLYKCLLAHTAQADWVPGAAPSLWVRIDDPAIEWPDWQQPAGAHNAYAKGAKVSHNGKHWESTVAANTWEPGVYGWKEVTG